MKRDRRKLALAVMFLVFALLCAIGWATQQFQSYYPTGLILFTIVGLGFLRSSKG